MKKLSEGLKRRGRSCLSKPLPAQEVFESASDGKPCTPDLHRLQHARVTQLIQNHIRVENAGRLKQKDEMDDANASH